MIFDNKIMIKVVGSARFERAISASQTQNHTKLDHDPNELQKIPNLSFTDNHFKGNSKNKNQCK